MEFQTGVQRLPPEMLFTIFAELDLDTKKKCRLVCHQWKTWIDKQVEFKVTLDDQTTTAVRKFNPSRPVRTMVVGGLSKRMVSCSASRSIMGSKEVKELVLAGRSEYKDARNAEVKPFQYPFIGTSTSRKFVHWMSRELWLCGISELNLRNLLRLNPNITVLALSTDVFGEVNDTKIMKSFQCPNLKTLEVTVVHHSNSRVVDKVHKCLPYLFEKKFPNLESVSLTCTCPCSCLNTITLLRFYKFVIRNKDSVKELRVHHHKHFRYFLHGCVHEKQFLKDLTSIRLKKLSISIDTTDLHPKVVFSDSFEIQLLMHQDEIEILHLNFGTLYAESVFGLLPRSKFLKAVSLRLHGSRYHPMFIDLQFLRVSQELKTLEIMVDQDCYSGSQWRIQKIEYIPKSVEVLSLSCKLAWSQAMWIEASLLKLIILRYYRGIQRDLAESLITLSELDYCTYHHFVSCSRNMKGLKEFILSWKNKSIVGYVATSPDNRVQFKVEDPRNY